MTGREGDADMDERQGAPAGGGEQAAGGLDHGVAPWRALGDAEADAAVGVQHLVLVMEREDGGGHRNTS
ncbi:hypothetical protein ACFSTI_16625 [Rhizorhabdus histidinilytica]